MHSSLTKVSKPVNHKIKVIQHKKEKRFFNLQFSKINKKLLKFNNFHSKARGVMTCGLPQIKVKVGKNKICTKALIDSGCSAIVCNAELYYKMYSDKSATELKPYSGEMYAANKTTLKILGTTNFKLNIYGFTWYVQALVVHNISWNLVLGINFMVNSKLVLDVNTKTAYFKFKPQFNIPIEIDMSSGINNMQPDVKIGLEEARPAVEQLIKKYPNVFTDKIGRAIDLEVKIELKDPTPVKLRPYYMSPPTIEKVNKIVKDLEQQGVIERSLSPYCSPVFLTKNDRMVINYNVLNTRVNPVFYPLGDLQNMHVWLSNSKIYSIIDLRKAFHQIPLAPESRPLTAFSTYYGSYQWKTIPFGLQLGSAVLSSYLDKIFSKVKGKFLINYVDDIILFSKD